MIYRIYVWRQMYGFLQQTVIVALKTFRLFNINSFIAQYLEGVSFKI